MSTPSQHPTDDQLQEFIDAGQTSPDVRKHLDSCSRCRQTVRVMARVDHGLKTLPLDRTGVQFTEFIMSRLHHGSSSSVLFRLLGGLASLFGLFFVLVVMISVFLLTGVIDMGEVTERGTKLQQLVQQVGGVVSHQVGVFDALLREYLPFAFGTGSIGITMVVMLVVSALAIADRVLGRKYVAR